MADTTWKVVARLSDASKVEVSVPKEATVLEIKEAFSPLVSAPASALKLVFKGRILADADTLTAHGA